MADSSARSRAVPWDRIEADRLVLVLGPEDLLADRAVQRLGRLAREEHADLDFTQINAADAGRDALAAAASGSLFADYTVVVVNQAEKAGADFLNGALAYVASPSPDAMVIFRHAGGRSGKKLVDALRKARAAEVQADPIRYDRDKEAFARAEFRRGGRGVDARAVTALVEAVGSDLRELASAAEQMMADTTGPITAQLVERYYGGRLETTSFKVADAAVVGNVGEALRLARYALGSGVDPVPMIGALAGKLRTLAKVGGAVQVGKDPVKDLKMNSWQADQARRALQHWDGAGLARAILAVAKADAQVKGLGGSSSKTARQYAVERAIVAVATSARA
ncbi:MAG: DNA polymerase III subunit delta [Bifidobacteriaceae bacterium]|jgi:DNA polymerase-3 subunit delta|nr:DNA polymerase III subunit delta [Bifidobacteriaceae bacterium]